MSVVMTGAGGGGGGGGGHKSNTRRTNSLQVYFCTLCKVFEEKTSSDMGPKGKGIKGNPRRKQRGGR